MSIEDGMNVASRVEALDVETGETEVSAAAGEPVEVEKPSLIGDPRMHRMERAVVASMAGKLAESL